MDFLPKTANLQGEDTRKTPKNTQFSKSRQNLLETRVPPTPTPPNPPNHGKTSQSFIIQIPSSAWRRAEALTSASFV